MSKSYEEAAKSVFDSSTTKMDAEMSQDIVVVSKGGRGKKISKNYKFHYNMSPERLPSIFGVSGYHVLNFRGEV